MLQNQFSGSSGSSPGGIAHSHPKNLGSISSPAMTRRAFDNVDPKMPSARSSGAVEMLNSSGCRRPTAAVRAWLTSLWPRGVPPSKCSSSTIARLGLKPTVAANSAATAVTRELVAGYAIVDRCSVIWNLSPSSASARTIAAAALKQIRACSRVAAINTTCSRCSSSSSSFVSASAAANAVLPFFLLMFTKISRSKRYPSAST